MKQTKLFLIATGLFAVLISTFGLLKIFHPQIFADGGDVTPPTFNFTSAPTGNISGSSVTYTFSTTDSESSINNIEYALNPGPTQIVRKIYVDGVQVGSSHYTSNIPDILADNFTIGQAGGVGSNFAGSIDEVRIYNRALNSREVDNLYDYPADTLNVKIPVGGTIASWNMDGAWNGTPGEVTDDQIGMNGSIENGVTQSPGILDEAATFDGVDDYISFGDVSLLPSGNSYYSISAWIKPDAMTTSGILGWGNFGATSYGSNGLLLLDTGINNFWWDDDYSETTADLSGSWHHVVVTYGPDRIPLNAQDGVYEETSEGATVTLNEVDFTLGEAQTITFYSIDEFGNTGSTSYNFTFVGDSDVDLPSITFTESPTGLQPAIFTYSGTATDATSNISYIDWQIDSGSRSTVFALDGDYDEQSEGFELEVKASPEFANITGTHTIKFYVVDIENNEQMYSFNVDVDRDAPNCTPGWVYQENPYIGNTVTYANIHCTENRDQITAAYYDVYHAVEGTLISPQNINPVDGVFDENSEDFTFTFTLDANTDLDGPIIVTFKTEDEAGNISLDLDPFVIEYVDDSEPVINLDQVTPDPISDTTPKITGSCVDDTQFDTNSYIKLIEYNVDGGAWSNVDSLEAPYEDSYSEIFSFELPEQSIGSHIVNIRCTDMADQVSTDSDTFEIVAVNEALSAGNFSHTDSFTDHTFQDIPNSTLIWGNGRLRLKEDITITRSVIDNADYPNRYADVRSYYGAVKDPDDSNLIWYTKNNRIYKYFINSNTTEALDMNTIFGFASFQELHKITVNKFGTKKLLWAPDAYGMSVYNITDNQTVRITITGGVNELDPDVDRGRLGAYLTTGTPVPMGYTNFIYYNFNNTLTNTGDDVTTQWPIDANFSETDALRMFRDKTTNTNDVYLSYYTNGKLVKFNDNNTPSNFADDQVLSYSGYTSIFGFSLDSQGRLIFGTANNSNGELFVVTNDNNTPYIGGDDTITRIATNRQLGFGGVFGVDFMEGQNDVGDQILVTMAGGDMVYINFNDTYTDLLDDTFIPLPVRGGIRPGDVTALIIDYDNLYVNIDTLGFYKVHLNRGWVDSGEAIGVPQRPSQKLILDNFVASAETGSNIVAGVVQEPSFLQKLINAFIPKVKAAENGISYYISNDDGVTWQEVTLGQIKNLNPNDYRVKFKIVMTELTGQSPTLQDYTVSFAGYTTPEQAQEATALSIIAHPTSVLKNTNFNITVSALDTLGFVVPSYSNTVTLELLNNGNVTSGLTPSSINITNGTATITNAQVQNTGVYRIRATQGALTAQSNQLTVTQQSFIPISANATLPVINFEADKYTIKKGDSVTLTWTSANLDTLTLTPNKGVVDSTGSYTLSLDETTEFTLSGTGPNGELSSSLTIVVQDETLQDLTLKTSQDISIKQGEKATITWQTTGADTVFIDLIGKNVSSKGSYEFYPTEDTVVTITAFQGDKSISQKIKVNVLNDNSEANQVVGVLSQVPTAGVFVLGIINSGLLVSLLLNVLTSVQSKLTLDTLSNILRIIGIIPFKKRRGFVYQTNTSKPVAFAVLNILSKGKTLTSIISDLNGIYYEPFLSKGEYILDVKREEHAFPTAKKRPAQLTEFDFYKGEELNITSNKLQQAIVIPMDKTNMSDKKSLINWNKISLSLTRLLVWLQWTVYPMCVLALVFLITSPNIVNLLVFVFYFVIVAFKLKEKLKTPSLEGLVYDKEANKGISGVVVELRANNQLVALEITNSKGRYSFFVPEGKYSIHLSHEHYAMRTEFGQVLEVDIKDTKKKMNFGMGKLG